MKTYISKLMVFFLPILLNIRFLYIPNLDFILSTFYFVIALFFFKSDLLSSKKHRGILLLIIIVFLSSVSLLRDNENEILTNFRLSYILLLYSISTIIFFYHLRYSNNTLSILFYGLTFYLYIVLIATYLNPQSYFNYFFNDPLNILAQSNRNISVNFVFATNSVNHFAILVSFAIVFYLVQLKRNRRVFPLFNIMILFVLLLSTKARLSIIIVGFLAIIIFIDKLDWIFNKWIIISIPVFLILISNLESLFDVSYLTNFFISKDELYTFNGRLTIWNAVFLDLINFKFEHLIGMGGSGNLQMPSVKMLFLSRGTSVSLSYATTHNTYLQMIADMGYFFLILFIVFLVKQYNILKRHLKNSNFKLIAFVILFFQFAGMAEAVWGNYLIANVVILIALFSYVIFSPNKLENG